MSTKPKNSVIGTAVLAALASFSMAALAQQNNQLERVEVTGSSIKRIAAEGALPVQVVTAEQIRASGAANLQDVIQRLPAMQGFTIADTAIGTNSGGYATASIHDLGSGYTLVLVNGRRIAPLGDGNIVNLNNIPMSAIERVEVLTDGASALYGSDAIAGVVNFVLKKNHQGGTISVQANKPTEGGAESQNISLMYGFGDLDKDRFNILGTFRHDNSGQLKSGERDFAAHAYLPFSQNGKSYIYDRTSPSADPANATATFKTGSGLGAYSFNPYLKANGQCAPNNYYSLANTIPAGSNATAGTAQCAFDFVTTIDIYPEFTRDSLFLTGEAKLTENISAFSDFSFSRYDVIARIAPNPVPINIPVGSALYNKYVMPYLTPAQQANVSSVSASYRASDFGPRTSNTVTDATHFVGGLRGTVAGWDVESAVTWSRNKLDESYTDGYMRKAEFTSLVASGMLDPFVPSGNQSAATQKLIADSIYHGSIRESSTTLKGIDARASSDVYKLPAGMVSMGVGADLRNYHYLQTPSADAVNGVIYNFAANPAYDLERSNYGLYTEFIIPVAKSLELNAGLRYDVIDPVKDAINKRDFGQKLDATTYKLSARYQPTKEVLIRSSYGTGFKAPDMLDIAQPLVTNGVTAKQYDCPFPGDGTGAPPCKPGKSQYTQLAGGNENIKPEQSKQFTFGVHLEPNNHFSIGADYWEVKMTDAISGVSENQAFADPQKYASLFTTYRLPAETNDYYAFKALRTNIGQVINKGIDWQFEGRTPIEGLGRVTLNVAGTYMLKSAYTRPGTSDDFTDSMGHYGENAAVTFRNIAQATLKIESGAFVNQFVAKYRSGYTDITQTVRDAVTGLNTKVTLDVPEYLTFDYQGVWKYSKALELRLGVNNLLNEKPPLTLRDSSGHQVGYDPRYASPLLRTVYVAGSYNF
ncbi:TonB-dependent receptor plug domain-containing protein [Roseateles violae]|uniref:TonB-dependent receptor n=1 Tax=Roseateles violae TaxID=3058042 RepID=A0ABT8DRG6_9BURK|nr:TonB-dependent receptor [Pelomonas sp. PFR6]MDN3918884.1 TonB-dependent receptor [Pelomonas sp. PFR6]